MEIDAAVKSVLLVVESHNHCLRLRSLHSDGAGLDPAPWSKRTPASENPTTRPKPSGLEPYIHWDKPGPSHGMAMMRIHPLQPTAAAFFSFRVSSLTGGRRC